MQPQSYELRETPERGRSPNTCPGLRTVMGRKEKPKDLTWAGGGGGWSLEQ